ncbi:MAG: DUF1836 domain-containing protein [Ndongobacter sp.]|nr:DUF1836 domain-containing protein [Ndongobacter sp.]
MEYRQDEVRAEKRLPKFDEIPDVGLFLEQTAKYLSKYTALLNERPVTGSMISNYVKKGLVANPVKKQYGPEQIAVLLIISLVKSVLLLEEIQFLLELAEETGSVRETYHVFREELEEALHGAAEAERNDADKTEARALMRSTVFAVAQRAALEEQFMQARANR